MTRVRALRHGAGFTLVELLIVIAIIGIVANIVIPSLLGALQEARVRAIVGDYQAVRHAVHEYYVDSGEYPRDRGAGRVPPELEPYLKDRVFFGWRAARYRYDWENWVRRRDGRPNGRARRLGVVRGMSVRTNVRNHRILQDIQRHYKGELVVRRRFVTFIMEPYNRS